MDIKPLRGDMFLAEMKQTRGSEQAGCRPVVIVQNDVGNRYSPTTIIVPLTTKKKRSMPTHVHISHSELKSIST
ncbi:MAG: type II toxin-antitoxin system PemK/MazF family toxin, partial [Ruminococcus sp.]|nr:type II toxin-antitoxin system PemK/MazF family toxin [Ruminococcus sp.]